MPVILRENTYGGLNAHLQSAYQNGQSWEEFHSAHIVDLARRLAEELVPRYQVRLGRSLQIREFHPITGERIRRPKPDVLISDRFPTTPTPSQSTTPSAVPATAPTLVMPAAATFPQEDEQEYLRAVLIYDESLGQPVTHLELLSPVNKLPGEGAWDYIAKRRNVLSAGVPMVELDYLHQSRSPIAGISDYTRGETNAYPYAIVVTDPRPTLAEGQARVYGFHVDDPIPTIDLPLTGDDVHPFDFGAAYHFTFSSFNTFYGQVDYEQLPAAFQTYQEEDRQRIMACQQRVLSAVNQQNEG